MLNDTLTLFGRSMRHIMRSPDTIITVAVTPVAIMLMFVYVMGGAVDAGGIDYVNYVVPGILLIAIASGIAYTALRIFTDVQKGLFQRFDSMPISRSSMLWAHVLTSLVSNTITIVVIFAVAFIMGFRPSAGLGEWLAVVGILELVTLALTWVALVPGLMAKTMEGATTFSYPLIFLPFISSAFVPTATMPGPVRAFAENQPVTSIVETVRSLLLGQPVGNDIWIAHRLVCGHHHRELSDCPACVQARALGELGVRTSALGITHPNSRKARPYERAFLYCAVFLSCSAFLQCSVFLKLWGPTAGARSDLRGQELLHRVEEAASIK